VRDNKRKYEIIIRNDNLRRRNSYLVRGERRILLVDFEPSIVEDQDALAFQEQQATQISTTFCINRMHKIQIQVKTEA